MKSLIDGTTVSSRIYYYLLDFNEATNWKFINENFNKQQLNKLTIQEFKQLFEHAMRSDLTLLNDKIKSIDY